MPADSYWAASFGTAAARSTRRWRRRVAWFLRPAPGRLSGESAAGVTGTSVLVFHPLSLLSFLCARYLRSFQFILDVPLQTVRIISRICIYLSSNYLNVFVYVMHEDNSCDLSGPLPSKQASPLWVQALTAPAALAPSTVLHYGLVVTVAGIELRPFRLRLRWLGLRVINTTEG